MRLGRLLAEAEVADRDTARRVRVVREVAPDVQVHVLPMIRTASWFAPTVPSEPSHKNIHSVVQSVIGLKFSTIGREKCVTSSLMPILKMVTGFSSKLSKTAIAIAGVNSFDPRPYWQPTQTSGICASRRDVEVQRPPNEPAFFVWSRTVILLTVFGSAARTCLALHGGAGGPR